MAQMCWNGGGLLLYELRMLSGRRKCLTSLLCSALQKKCAHRKGTIGGRVMRVMTKKEAARRKAVIHDTASGQETKNRS